VQARGYTPFSLQLARGDAQQRVQKFQVTTPAGFSAM